MPSDPRGNGKKSSSTVLIVIGLVALGAGVGGGVLLLQGAKAKQAATPAQQPPPSPVETAAAPSDPTNGVAAPGTVPTARSEIPTGTPAVAAPGETPEAPASAAAVESVAPVPPAPPPAVPPASFDLEKIPGDRAALLVHSGATARVFVHGRDYGETNQYLLTSCGIRFVRIGRGFNDFLEPGHSLVVKCGRVTEITIEPDR